MLGLTAAEVAQRRSAGLTNDVPAPTSRSYGEIVRANVFTRFNAVLGSLLVAILAVGDPRDALFGIVLVLNALIGIIQESRSKWTLDRLTLLSAPHSTVIRDGARADVPVAELVQDDVIVLAAGDQVSVDGTVLEGTGFEIDESLLTGEADPVAKTADDDVRSGSFVAAGSGTVRATAVGADSYAFQLGAEARRFSLVQSELRDGINLILRVCTWILVPTGIALIASQWRAGEDWRSAVQGSVAGMVAMIPEGLVLLTSTALAVGVIRLGRRKVLTQELNALEGLARVDVVCVDKTGTLTEGTLGLAAVEPVGGGDDATAALASLVGAEERPNPTLAAIGEGVDEPIRWPADDVVPFSSARKWSAAGFGARGTWVLGAPDILVDHVAIDDRRTSLTRRVEELSAAGRRVLLLTSAPAGLAPEGDGGRVLPDDLVPRALVVLDEKIRPEAPGMVEFFAQQGVALKVISGDNPVTVGAVAARCGIPGADEPVDARALPDDPDGLAEHMERSSVFGRVTPQQKRAMVHALQSRGHEVAMTGDGVNDTLALKDAEIGVAMGSGSPAARAVARFVLLDNSFAVFPFVVAEGRRVIANVERVSNLFLTKTFYAMLLSLAVVVAGLPFPFLPRHLTLISALSIGIPGFFLALAPNVERARPGFLDRVLRFAIPAGALAAVATYAGYAAATNWRGESLEAARTTAVITLFIVVWWVLVMLARPLTWTRSVLAGGMVVLFLAAFLLPAGRAFFELAFPSPATTALALLIGVVSVLLLEAGWHLAHWTGSPVVRQPAPTQWEHEEHTVHDGAE
jgi:cation-transporting ATPase E